MDASGYEALLAQEKAATERLKLRLLRAEGLLRRAAVVMWKEETPKRVAEDIDAFFAEPEPPEG